MAADLACWAGGHGRAAHHPPPEGPIPPRGREVTRIAMSEIQEQIQRHIDTLVGVGAETGVQVAVYQDSALIVDAVAGTADSATGRPVTSGTPIFSFSTGKNVAATLAHLLVARGFL